MAETPKQTQAPNGSETRRPSHAGAKVTVACNLPHGLLLRVFRPIKQRVVIGVGRHEMIDMFEVDGAPVHVFGVATEVGKVPRAPIVGGYALTKGVDKDFWDRWLEANEDSQMVKNKCVFAWEREGFAEGEAHENEGRKTNMEPFNPDGTDVRKPKQRGELTTPTKAVVD